MSQIVPSLAILAPLLPFVDLVFSCKTETKEGVKRSLTAALAGTSCHNKGYYGSSHLRLLLIFFLFIT